MWSLVDSSPFRAHHMVYRITFLLPPSPIHVGLAFALPDSCFLRGAFEREFLHESPSCARAERVAHLRDSPTDKRSTASSPGLRGAAL